MPGGDHLNVMDPPGLTVMRIAGGRYRVTAVHRVVWTWMNEFAPVIFIGQHNPTAPNRGDTADVTSENVLSTVPPKTGLHTLQVGDLVAMTIVDVFECDQSGKLLSYCPTFDNRAVNKIDRTTHNLRKQTTAITAAVKKVQTSKFATAFTKYTTSIAHQVQQRVSDVVQNYHHPSKTLYTTSNHTTSPSSMSGENHVSSTSNLDAKHDELLKAPTSPKRTASHIASESTSMYNGDDDMERHEV
jgi:hypothetical protein